MNIELNTEKDVFSAIIANIPEILYRRDIDSNFGFEYISQAITKLTGFEIQSYTASSQSWLNMIFPKDEKSIRAALALAVKNKKTISVEYRLLNKQGDYIYVLEKASPLLDEFGNVQGICGIIFDNSDIKRAQDELARTQMLQSLGKLAAGVAHEINTPIQFIGDNIRFFSDSFEEIKHILNLYQKFVDSNNLCCSKDTIDEISQAQTEYDIDFLKSEIPIAIKQTIEGIERVTTMVSVMKDFSHLDERRKTATDINKLVESAVILSKNEIKYIADIDKKLEKNLPKVICCIDEIYQVLLNLLINAAHSIQDKNATENKNEKGIITINTKLENGSVIIKVADTGTGIPDEIKDKIFDQFFTTKKKGKGTGQGLAISHSIICEKHNGTLTVESSVGKGACFIVTIPINAENNERLIHKND